MSTSPAGGSRGEGERPPSSGKPRSDHGILSSLVRVDSLVQIALIVPTATFVGWAIGVGLDHWLHQKWMFLAGLILGAVAGFVEIFRKVALLSKE